MLGLASGILGYNASRASAKGIAYGAFIRSQLAMRRAAEAELAADEVRHQGRVNAGIRVRKSRTQAGAVTAATAANGLDISVGTAARIPNLTLVYGALEAALIQRNAHKQGRKLDIEASSLRLQALGELLSGSAQANAERTAGTISLIKGVDETTNSLGMMAAGGA